MAKEEEERSQEVVLDVRIYSKREFLMSFITWQKKTKMENVLQKLITKITIKTNKYVVIIKK